MKTAQFHEVAVLLVDSHHGIYSGQLLAEHYELPNLSPEDKQILLNGPDDESYVEVWSDLEGETVMIDGEAYEVRSIDGDTWAIPANVEITNWGELA
jgi:hypothetical protein